MIRKTRIVTFAFAVWWERNGFAGPIALLLLGYLLLMLRSCILVSWCWWCIRCYLFSELKISLDMIWCFYWQSIVASLLNLPALGNFTALHVTIKCWHGLPFLTVRTLRLLLYHDGGDDCQDHGIGRSESFSNEDINLRNASLYLLHLHYMLPGLQLQCSWRASPPDPNKPPQHWRHWTP